MRNILLCCVVLAAVNCSALRLRRTSAEERDLVAVARVVLPLVGKDGATTFVVGSGLTSVARRALRTVSPIVEVATVPGLAPKGIAGLPAGYFLVHTFAITGNTAEFRGTRGPVPSGRPGRLNCGSGYQFELDRTAAGWKVGKFDFIQC